MANKSLGKLKGELEFNRDLKNLLNVMKGIAASQYRIMESKMTAFDLYEAALKDLFETYDFRDFEHPFIKPVNTRKVVCLITTDFGFMGGLNMKVIQAGLEQEEQGTSFLVFGERGVNFVREMGRSYTAMPGIQIDASRFGLVDRAVEYLTKAILRGGFGPVSIVYPYPASFTVQRVETAALMPCPLFLEDRPKEVPSDEEQALGVILESEGDGIIEYLTTLWLRRKLLQIFEYSKLSEFGARTMHLEESHQTLSKMDGKLKLEYFKMKHEKIDQSLRESFAAQVIE